MNFLSDLNAVRNNMVKRKRARKKGGSFSPPDISIVYQPDRLRVLLGRLEEPVAGPRGSSVSAG